MGCGKIGEALVKGFLKHLPNSRFIATARSKSRVDYISHFLNIEATRNNREAVGKSGIIILAVKPLQIPAVARDISEFVNGKILVSVAAGVSISSLMEMFPGARIFRAMPNIAAKVNSSFTAISPGPGVSDKDVEAVYELFRLVGECIVVDECLMNALTALNGSGPAYVLLVLEALKDAGLKIGLPGDLALKISAYVMLGTAKLILELNEHPAKIRDLITTPAGTTIEGLFILEKYRLKAGIMEALEASMRRAEKIFLDIQKAVNTH
ncbi:MAG: pyrroline-5-carboxylate reductase [Candidatus Methanomethylicia archaeon]